MYETVELTPARFAWTRVHPSGRREQFDCNPYWARVALREWPDGRTDLRIVSQGKELAFARFLTDDERRDFASALQGALHDARGGGASELGSRTRNGSNSHIRFALSQGSPPLITARETHAAHIQHYRHRQPARPRIARATTS